MDYRTNVSQKGLLALERFAFIRTQFDEPYLVGVQIMLRSYLGKCLVAAQNFKRNLRLEIIRKSSSFRHVVLLLKGVRSLPLV